MLKLALGHLQYQQHQDTSHELEHQ
jgi:hypothetical protein